MTKWSIGSPYLERCGREAEEMDLIAVGGKEKERDFEERTEEILKNRGAEQRRRTEEKNRGEEQGRRTEEELEQRRKNRRGRTEEEEQRQKQEVEEDSEEDSGPLELYCSLSAGDAIKDLAGCLSGARLPSGSVPVGLLKIRDRPDDGGRSRGDWRRVCANLAALLSEAPGDGGRSTYMLRVSQDEVPFAEILHDHDDGECTVTRVLAAGPIHLDAEALQPLCTLPAAEVICLHVAIVSGPLSDTPGLVVVVALSQKVLEPAAIPVEALDALSPAKKYAADLWYVLPFHDPGKSF